MQPQTRILCSGTMRTGGSLLSNLMCAHSKTFVFGERFHFFRFCYGRYDPLTEKDVERMLRHQELRLRRRFEIPFDVDAVFEAVKARGISYANIYDEGMKYFLEKVERSIWGEYVAMQWRDFPVFLNMFPNARAIHIYRDPRAVLSSWKHVSIAPENLYLNTIFNWIDSMNCVNRYKTELPTDRYLSIRYESLMEEPETYTRMICDFINVDFESEMLDPSTWHNRLPKGLLINPQSAHEGLNIRGFSTTRINNWVKNLDEWETGLVETLCGELMTAEGYECHKSGYSTSDIRRGFEFMGRQPLLMQRLNHFLSTGEGSPKYHNNPTDITSWSAARRDITARFTDAESEDAVAYPKELEEIETDMADKYGDA